MRSFTVMKGAFCVYVALCVGTDAWCKDNPGSDTPAVTPTITVTGVEVRERHFRLDYKIENSPKSDIWICDAMDSIQWGSPAFEAVLSNDGGTVIIRTCTILQFSRLSKNAWPCFASTSRTRATPCNSSQSRSVTPASPVS